MKILYALLAAGNGHLSRAREVIPHLQKHGSVAIAISGTDGQVALPVEISHKHHGLIFHLGKRGGIDYWKTAKDIKLPKLIRDVRSFPIHDYDVVINDFEPITARCAKKAGVPIVGLSHQASFASKLVPRPPKAVSDFFANAIIKHYAACDQKIGLHFQQYDDFIRTPVIRSDVRNLVPQNDGHVTVYLPAYEDAYLIELFKGIPEKKWDLFSKRGHDFSDQNVRVRPIAADSYTSSLGNCDGLLTGGGFESPAEAMFLGKKVMMVPQKAQYEQRCNAEAARRMGVPVLESVHEDSLPLIRDWANSGQRIHVDFPDHTADVVAEALELARHACALPLAS
jgi:uncharacterized protein (TIGR00661 family)